jgi:hypothetical protein
MDSQSARSRQVDTTTFWHIIFPVLVLVILLFVLFVVYSMPQWAIGPSTDLESLRRFPASVNVGTK